MKSNFLWLALAGIVAYLFLSKKAAAPGSPAALTPTSTNPAGTDPFGIFARTAQVQSIFSGVSSLTNSLSGLFKTIKPAAVAQTTNKTMDANAGTLPASVTMPVSYSPALGQFVNSPDTTYFYGNPPSFWTEPVDYVADFSVN